MSNGLVQEASLQQHFSPQVNSKQRIITFVNDYGLSLDRYCERKIPKDKNINDPTRWLNIIIVAKKQQASTSLKLNLRLLYVVDSIEDGARRDLLPQEHSCSTNLLYLLRLYVFICSACFNENEQLFSCPPFSH